MKISIEDLLARFYESLIKEYDNEPKDYHKSLYNYYVDRETQQLIENQELNDFYTYPPCRPKGWANEICMWVNLYGQIDVYFCSLVDLAEYAHQLVQDNNFKELVKTAFYIKKTIHPKV